MKIKFIKEYRALVGEALSGSATCAVGTVVDTTEKSAMWLIDNGFAEEVKESGWWKPNYGDKYYTIRSNGECDANFWRENLYDKCCQAIGNVFKSREAAERYCDYLEAIATVRQDEGVLTPEQVNELIKNEDLAYYVGYMGNRGNGEILCGCTMGFEDCWMPVGVILFDSEEHVDRSLRKHPDEWKTIVNYKWGK